MVLWHELHSNPSPLPTQVAIYELESDPDAATVRLPYF